MSGHKVTTRFLEYTKVNTTSNPNNIDLANLPTSKGQLELAELIKKELSAIPGAHSIHLKQGILYAKLNATEGCEKWPCVGFTPHLDTSPEYDLDTKAEIIEYVKGDILLKDNKTTIPSSELGDYRNQEIIVTDGTSLLGGDDKAAISAVVTAVEEIIEEKTPHGPIDLAFLPDEEIGLLGAKTISKDIFNPSFGYCLDCCAVGEYVTKTWSAASAKITIHGTPAHPMSCKGSLVNPITILSDEIICKIPEGERPEDTEGEQGFLFMKNVKGNGNILDLDVLLRYFDNDVMLARKNLLEKCVETINEKYPLAKTGRASIVISDTYRDTSDILGKHPHVTKLLLSSMEKLSIVPKPIIMRGGYDGCALASLGIPMANFFTGAHNFHSNTEFLPVPSLIAAKDMVKTIIANVGEVQ